MKSGNLKALATATDKLIGSPYWTILNSSNPTYQYLNYLAATCHIIRSSVDVMEAAIATSTAKHYPVLTAYLEKHIEEESNHYEWALADLRCTTDKSESFLTRTFCTEVLAVPGIAYYQIRNISPFAVIGYMLSLESHPPTIQAISYLQKKTSLDKSAFRTLIIHADADIGHATELYDLIDNLKPDDSEFCAISSSLLMTNIAYGAACRAVLG